MKVDRDNPKTKKLVIVDVETSGGRAEKDRIVEIGLVLMDGDQVINRFQSLVNPQILIPDSLTAIHGINDEMVREAPIFAALAPQLMEMLEDRIFVAHNVHFDYGFMEAEFRRAGYEFRSKKLCTVRLSRRLLKLKSHSLAALCRHFSIVNQRAHRALEDALATAEILKKLLPMPGCSEIISEMTRGRAGVFIGPGNLPEEKLNQLPEKTGVYLFYNAQGKVIYVGKAKNLRERVHQHFGANTHTKEKRQFLESVFNLSFEVCGHELMALLMENELIKKHYPQFNRLNKDFRLNYGIYCFEDQRGFQRLAIGQAGKWSRPLQVFRSRAEAFTELLNLSIHHGLCLQLNGLSTASSPPCSYLNENGEGCIACRGSDQDTYNKAVEKLRNQNFQDGTALLRVEGRNTREVGLVLLESGRITGYGYVSEEVMKNGDMQIIRNMLWPYYDTQDAQSILRPWMQNIAGNSTEQENGEISKSQNQEIRFIVLSPDK